MDEKMSESSLTNQLQDILDRHRAGDPTARDAIIGRSLDRLRRLARGQLNKSRDLRSLDETDDVLSKAVMRLYKALKSVQPVNATAFFAIAGQQIQYVLLDLVREKKRSALASATELPYSLAAPGTSFDSVHIVIAELPEDEQKLFRLIVYQGLPLADAAKHIGVPLRTLSRRWKQAREHLALLVFDQPESDCGTQK